MADWQCNIGFRLSLENGRVGEQYIQKKGAPNIHERVSRFNTDLPKV